MMGQSSGEHSLRLKLEPAELVELKRHAHEIPECPGLDRRIQRYRGTGPLLVSVAELDWLIAVLDAVLADKNGYPCIEHDPWKLEYVPSTDPRCTTCRRLLDRLVDERERTDRHHATQ